MQSTRALKSVKICINIQALCYFIYFDRWIRLELDQYFFSCDMDASNIIMPAVKPEEKEVKDSSIINHQDALVNDLKKLLISSDHYGFGRKSEKYSFLVFKNTKL